MKKNYTFVFLLIFFCSQLFAQKAMDLDLAIKTAANEISKELPEKVPTAVIKIFSDSQDLSTYISDGLVTQLSKIKKQTIIERNEKKMALINAELDYQYSGSVSDSSMVELGYQLGAKFLIYGSFDQLGDLMQLTIQAANVESAEIVYLNSFSIASSSKTTELLGDNKKLITANDFIETIARCDTKINAIERDKAKAIQKKRLSADTEYNQKLEDINSIEKLPWESDNEFAEKKLKLTEELSSRFDIDMSMTEKSVAIPFDSQIKLIEIQKKQIFDDLTKTTFVIEGDFVDVTIGEFDPNAKQKNWPVTIKSLDKMINYTYRGKYVVDGTDIKKEYEEIENIRKNNSLSGEIRYQIIPADNNTSNFQIKIINVKIYDTDTDNTILNEDVNEKLRMNNSGIEKKGTSTKTSNKSQKKTTSTVSTNSFSSEESDLAKELEKANAEKQRLQQELENKKKFEKYFPIYIFNDELAKKTTLQGWGTTSQKNYSKDFSEGKSCLKISNFEKYGGLDIPLQKMKIDLSNLENFKENAYLTFYVKFQNTNQYFILRIIDTYKGKNNLPWRLDYTVEAAGKKMNEWIYIKIPISDMSDVGAYVNDTDTWYNSEGKFDFSRVDILSIAADDTKIQGTILIDDIKIIAE